MNSRGKAHQGKFVNFIKHVHPVKIPAPCLSFKNTWGLGGMSLVLVLLLMVTGALLLLVYKPFPTLAYDSIVGLEQNYIFGKLVRSIHFFSASFLVVLSFCHMLRVFFTQGYVGIRRSNWMVGICILLLILFSCFTGYLLPWDQTAFWAVTICIHMFEYLPFGSHLSALVTEGQSVTEKTLQIFFTCHTTLIPLVMILLLGTHFWKIRKAGGVVFTNPADQGVIKKVRSYPHLFLRELSTGLVLVALIMTLSFLFAAPLGDMANAGVSPNPAKAPWYFAGLQELLLSFHPFVAVFIIPGTILVMLFSLPFLAKQGEEGGKWFLSKKAGQAGGLSALISCATSAGLIFLSEFDFHSLLPGIGQTELFSFILMVTMMTGNHFFLKKKFNLSRNEAIQSSFIFIVTGYIFLTAIGIWFRGKGMALTW